MRPAGTQLFTGRRRCDMNWLDRKIDKLIRKLSARKHDFAIGGDDDPYCLRWWVIPRNRVFNIYLHRFLRDDDDRALHDHPWFNCSIPLQNGYLEQRFRHPWQDGWLLPVTDTVAREPGSVTFRRASTPHRVVLKRDAQRHPIPAWSLFITGPIVRRWGFVCPGGRWVDWTVFTSFEQTGSSEKVGRGCTE